MFINIICGYFKIVHIEIVGETEIHLCSPLSLETFFLIFLIGIFFCDKVLLVNLLWITVLEIESQATTAFLIASVNAPFPNLGHKDFLFFFSQIINICFL
jgi:hypothetical protein